jgi:POT family proton-dependent oligopeptide transporter
MTSPRRKKSKHYEEVLIIHIPVHTFTNIYIKVAEHLPVSTWLVAVVELCERFTFYGCQGLFQNYIQRPLDGSLGRGALGTNKMVTEVNYSY